MGFDDFLLSMQEMTAEDYVAEWGIARLPSGLAEGDRLRVYAQGVVIVRCVTGGWRVELSKAFRYSTDQPGVTLGDLERLLWKLIQHGWNFDSPDGE